MQWIEEQPDLSYVTGLTSNQVLKALAGQVVEQAKRAYERDGGKITRFHSTRYQAGTWSRARRVIIKVEVSDQGVNTRFVVTDMEQAHAKVLYQHIYCGLNAGLLIGTEDVVLGAKALAFIEVQNRASLLSKVGITRKDPVLVPP